MDSTENNRAYLIMLVIVCSFFFQAEDGIRDGHVTGVQTCALPIYITLIIYGHSVPVVFLSWSLLGLYLVFTWSLLGLYLVFILVSIVFPVVVSISINYSVNGQRPWYRRVCGAHTAHKLCVGQFD